MSDKRVAVVTGAAAIGSPAWHIALAFAKGGWDVCVTGRHMKRLSQAAGQIAEQSGATVMPLVFECSRDGGEQNAAELAAKVEELMGPASVLVNASQAAKVGDALVSSKLADLYMALDSGVVAAYLLMRAFYPQLVQTHGMVVNLLSASAAAGQAGMSMLAASKEGLRGISRVAAEEWKEAGVRVECVEPHVRSSAFVKWAHDNPDAAQSFDGLQDPQAFAAHVVQIASDGWGCA